LISIFKHKSISFDVTTAGPEPPTPEPRKIVEVLGTEGKK